jgi:hypothetical protein
MSPSFTCRGNIRYNYYRCRSTAGGRPPCGINVPARIVHDLVLECLDEFGLAPDASLHFYW